jgi:4-hydroxy-tetrahydrodipicolinate synthase
MDQHLTDQPAISGIWPVLCTPFRSNGAIDIAAMKDVTRFAIHAGADGLVFPGFASEVDELTGSERILLLDAVLRETAGRRPIIAGATAPSLPDVLDRVAEARSRGIDTVMIQAPKVIGTDAAAVAAFYAAVANASPGVRIVLQNAPAPRGSDLSAEAVVVVARSVPAIRYVKEETIPSGGPISAILAARPPHLEGVIGGGGARFIIDECLRGACAAMPAVELTDVHAALWHAFKAGRLDEARLLYERSLPLLMIQSHARMRLTKQVLCRRGILSNDVVRANIPPFDARDIAEIDALLARIGDPIALAPQGARAAE